MASVKGLGCAAFHDELAALLLRASLDQREKDVCKLLVPNVLVSSLT